MGTIAHTLGRRTLFAAAALAAVAWLLLASAGRSDPLPPVVSLGPVTVANGLATVSGTLGGSTTADASVSINGQPVSVDASGRFSGTVTIGSQDALTIVVHDPVSGAQVTLRIPLTPGIVGPGGVVPSSVLSALEQAGISINEPPGGFKILDGLPLRIEGRVLDRDALASLTVNGADVLGVLKPDGSFNQTVPGSSKEVAVTATDRQGVSQTSTFSVERLSSVIQTPAGRSVSAAGALGLRIAAVRYDIKRVRATRRLRMTVTIKDTRGYLVRDAIVRVRAADFQAKRVIGGQQVKLTGRTGQASFVVRPRKQAFGKRLFMVAVAKTPQATARKTTSVRLPRLARLAARR